MGNCSTQQSDIQVPQDPTLSSKPYVKPSPLVFIIPTLANQNESQLADTGTFANVSHLSMKVQATSEVQSVKALASGGIHNDSIFKADRKSMGVKYWTEQVEWKRPLEILKDEPVFFEEDIDTFDLKIGKMENSYFISSLATLITPKQKLHEILHHILQGNFEVNQNGAYVFWLFFQGNWKQVCIDDKIPVIYNQYPFSHHRKQLWIWMLEKAMAKIYQSYQNLQRGLLGHTLSMLTGAPSEYLNTNSKQLIHPDTAWQFLKGAVANQFMVAVSTENVDRNQYFDKDSTFSYPVLDIQEVYILTTTKKKKQRILKLSNPWGRYEWKGRWSEYSDVWSEELRHQLHYEKADDTILWINVEDMLKVFGQVCISKYISTNTNTSLQLPFGNQQNEIKGVFLKANGSVKGTISLIQKHHKNMPLNYKYSMCRLILLEMDVQKSKPKRIIQQKYDCDSYCSIPFETQETGVYYLLIEMDWNSSHTRTTVLNVYASQLINLAIDPNVPTPESLFYELVALDQGTNSIVEVHTYPFDQNIKRVSGTFGGYVYYHYINNSTDNKCLSEVVKMGKSQNIVVCGENSSEHFAVNLQPGQEKLVKMKVGNEGNGNFVFDPLISNQFVEKFNKESLLEMLHRKPTKMRQREIEDEKIEVYIKTFEYSGGVALLYINNMMKFSFMQEIEFDVKNLQLQEDSLDEDCKLHLELEPNSEKLISLVIIDSTKPYSFSTKVQYYLSTPEFKF